ncbi:MAG TPA: type VI secretion system tip protein TssI/VgrG, partial [Planctomycetaceae bacterium]|nr:type VI secretion system tip protein TssI/VgrG [Planctomycetaceae bacterium]
MALDQTDRFLKVHFPDLGKQDVGILEEFQGEESLSQPFLYRLSIFSEEKELDPTKIVGKNVEFQVQYNRAEKIPFHGIALSLTRAQMDQEDTFFRYRLEVVPRFWFLKFRSDNRIFQEKTALEIIEAVLKDEKVEFVKKTSATYKKREYCVQFGESDFDFVSRLMEEEGIFYYFERAEKSHKLVLGDDIKAYQNAKENEPIFSGDRETAGAADLIEWEQTTEFVTGNYLQNDDNFQKFWTSNEGKSKGALTLKSAQTQEVYEYPAGYDLGDQPETMNDEKQRWPKIRLEELEVPAEIVRGESLCFSWTPGFKFKKDSAEYVLTSVTHRYTDVGGMSAGSADEPILDERHNFFTAMKATRVFRPLRVTPPSR